MYGHIRTAAPTILNLDHAREMYDAVKPIRGRAEDVRPFARRSDDTRTIRLNADETVSCRLYRTDVITYHADKIEVNLDGYTTTTTAAFLNDVLPLSFSVFNSKIWVYCLSTDNREKAGYYLVDKRSPNYFVRDSQGAFTVLENPRYPIVHHVDRKQANNVRKLYAPFKQYVINMFKLRDKVTPQEYGDMFGWVNSELPDKPPKLEVRDWITLNEKDLRVFNELALSENPEDQYKAYLWLLITQVGSLRTTWGSVQVQRDLALHNLNELILRIHRDTCFKVVERMDLKLCRDAYSAYF